jgi:hypothetical protein
LQNIKNSPKKQYIFSGRIKNETKISFDVKENKNLKITRQKRFKIKDHNSIK